jgi:hypothetical protein
VSIHPGERAPQHERPSLDELEIPTGLDALIFRASHHKLHFGAQPPWQALREELELQAGLLEGVTPRPGSKAANYLHVINRLLNRHEPPKQAEVWTRTHFIHALTELIMQAERQGDQLIVGSINEAISAIRENDAHVGDTPVAD